MSSSSAPGTTAWWPRPIWPRPGLDVLVVEAAATAGGMTSTNSFAPEAPEYTINEASIQASLFRTTTINDDLELSTRYGLRQTVIDPAHFQLAADGSSLGLWRDPRKTAAELEYFSKKDARALLELYEVIDAAVEIGLPMMQTNVVTARHQGHPEVRQGCGQEPQTACGTRALDVEFAGRGGRGELRARHDPRAAADVAAVHALRRRLVGVVADLPRCAEPSTAWRCSTAARDRCPRR